MYLNSESVLIQLAAKPLGLWITYWHRYRATNR